MADFIGCLLPLRESAKGDVFDVVHRATRALSELRASTRPPEWTTLAGGQRFKGTVKASFPGGGQMSSHLTFDFGLFGGPDGSLEERSLDLWFNYTDGGKQAPNLYLHIGRWGRYESVFEALEREFLDLLDLGKPVLVDGEPKINRVAA